MTVALTPPPGFVGAFRTDDDARAVYAEAAGIGRVTPRTVARPEDAASVERLVAWAAAHGIPLVPRGSGSGMAGGAIGDGVVLDLGALDAIAPVDPSARTVEVAAGVIRDAVDAGARAHGLRFPVDPSSGRFCTVGGMIGTNAAGARSLAFGAMRDSVVALDCVLADGARVTFQRGAPMPVVPATARLAAAHGALAALRARGAFDRPGLRKESSGYAIARHLDHEDGVDLIVGSEGTLCVVVGATLALRTLPGATSSVLAAFATLEQAVDAALRAREAGAVACELLDRTFLDVARAGGHGVSVPADTEAVLLAEVEGDAPMDARARAGRLAERFVAGGATTVVVAMEPEAEAALWEIRYAASPTIARLHPELRSMQFIEDGAVPPDRFAEYVRGVRAALVRRGMRGVIFGHAADAHAHVNPLVDVRRPDWRESIASLLDETTALVARLGGTLAAEHGDGRLRTPLLDRVWSAGAREAFGLVKRAFDPDGVLNPGVKVPLPGQQAIGRVKYDPADPVTSPAARAALATVERERAYAVSRLELLARAGGD